MIDCGIFKNVELTFLEPYASSDIDNFLVKGGHDPDTMVSFKFSQIIGCFFPFHLLKHGETDAGSNTSDPDQIWIFQGIHHIAQKK